MMKLKMLGLSALAVMALMGVATATASATALEVGGVKQGGKVTIEMSLETGLSTAWTRTDGSYGNTCTVSNVAGATESGFTTTPTGKLSSLTFEECDLPVTVHKPGQFYVQYLFGTDGTVFSENTEVTVQTAFGFTVNCKTGSGTPIGELEGVSSGHATLFVEAVINCGFLLPSGIWLGVYTVTSPTGLGVTT